MFCPYCGNKYVSLFEIVFGNGQVTDKIYRNGLKTSFKVLKEIIIWNTKRHTKPQKPRVSGVFLYPLISLRRPEMWWGFLCNIFVH